MEAAVTEANTVARRVVEALMASACVVQRNVENRKKQKGQSLVSIEDTVHGKSGCTRDYQMTMARDWKLD